MTIRQRLQVYLNLMRFEKPIGTLLLLWPTLWALWLASHGKPCPHCLIVFCMGVFLMRSAGCIINDFADRHFDAHVERTAQRPLARKAIHPIEALLLAGVLSSFAFLLVLTCNPLTIKLSFIGMALAVIYPFLKRVTHFPQVGLGLSFSWGIPMAFAATTNQVPYAAWFLFASSLLWPVIYDTMYAMADLKDDLKIGIKSTAIFFGSNNTSMIALMQVVFLVMFLCVGYLFHLRPIYFDLLFGVLILFLYQQFLLKQGQADFYLKAFLNHHWVGFLIFLGIFLSAHS